MLRNEYLLPEVSIFFHHEAIDLLMYLPYLCENTREKKMNKRNVKIDGRIDLMADARIYTGNE